MKSPVFSDRYFLYMKFLHLSFYSCWGNLKSHFSFLEGKIIVDFISSYLSVQTQVRKKTFLLYKNKNIKGVCKRNRRLVYFRSRHAKEYSSIKHFRLQYCDFPW